MKIALIGYGKMGKAIESVASQRGHEVVLKISSSNLGDLTKENLSKADVAIEFTNPASAIKNMYTCFASGVPVVCGSTGWLQDKEEVTKQCQQQNGTLIYASNFSIGVNLFFVLNAKLAAMMQQHKDYDVTIEETHHTQKKDAPSGTAISLAEGIINNNPDKTLWLNEPSSDPQTIPIISHRQDPAPGTHVVRYSSQNDTIEITHTAHNRLGFAGGAVLAAEYIVGKKGVFSMADVLGLPH